MARIDLSQGFVTIVDEEDHALLSRWRWAVQRRGEHLYARRNTGLAGRPEVTLYMHRVIMDAPKGLVVDHINGDGLDNRRVNLRIVRHNENLWNRAPPAGRFRGVSWSKGEGKWRATIDHCGRKFEVGFFDSADDAAMAWDYVAWRLRGSKSQFNFDVRRVHAFDVLRLAPTIRRYLANEAA